MNAEIFKGKWHQLKGTIKAKWGKLTDDEVTEVNGNAEVLSGKLQEKYGHSKDEAETEINKWMDEN